MAHTEKPYRLSAKALIRREDGAVLLLRRSASSRGNPNRWDLPGGKVDHGESFEQALRREVTEETGLEISLVGLIGATESENPSARIVCMVMEAVAVGGSLRTSAEHSEAKWVLREEIAQMEIVSYLRPLLENATASVPPHFMPISRENAQGTNLMGKSHKSWR